MEACKEPVLTVSSDQSGTEILRVSVDYSLETLHKSKVCPPPIKHALHGMISWHQRNETTISRAIHSSSQYLEFRAYLNVVGINPKEVKDTLEIPIKRPGFIVGFSDVHATPDDDPIVASYVSIQMKGQLIQTSKIALTGIKRRQITCLATVNHLDGKQLTDKVIEDFCNQIPSWIEPEGNYLGSAEYRQAMAMVTTKRALKQCMEEL
ncbi:MAG: hypothetical protein J7K85_00615 [Anaerolineaceae bacterium]|nr:hypothetical protein [Anaerolineaceae bacterium]